MKFVVLQRLKRLGIRAARKKMGGLQRIKSNNLKDNTANLRKRSRKLTERLEINKIVLSTMYSRQMSNQSIFYIMPLSSIISDEDHNRGNFN